MFIVIVLTFLKKKLLFRSWMHIRDMKGKLRMFNFKVGIQVDFSGYNSILYVELYFLI